MRAGPTTLSAAASTASISNGGSSTGLGNRSSCCSTSSAVEIPAVNLRRTYEFVGLDPSHRPRRLRRRENKTTARVALSPDERAALALAYHDDLRQLLTLVEEIDPSLWPTCADVTR